MTVALHKASPKPPEITTDAWVSADWAEFARLLDEPSYEAGRFYYDAGKLRIEMAALGPAHAADNSILSNVVTLFGTLKTIGIKELTNASFIKKGLRGCQPDTAFYVGADLPQLPRDNAPIDADLYGSLQLVIEIGSTTFRDDIGSKRLLYEQFGVLEYWVVNVAEGEVLAFAMRDGGSARVEVSQVLPGLEMAMVEEALKRGKAEDDGAINRWLIEQFS